MIGVAFFLDGLVQKLCTSRLAKQSGKMADRSINRNFVVLYPLCRRNQRRVLHKRVPGILHHVFGFGYQCMSRLAFDGARRRNARINALDMRQEFLQTLHVLFGLLVMRTKGLLQFLICGRVGHIR